MKEANLKLEESRSLAIVAAVSATDTELRREKLNALESAMLQEEQVDIPVKHRFSGGMYAREITIPKGTLLTGRIHKFDHFDVMLSGDISVSTDTGEVRRMTGLNIMEGKAGKKRAGYAHEDTHWITFHSAEERDPDEMYEFLTCGSFEELEDFNVMLNREDYRIMVENINMSDSEIREQVENEEDMIDYQECAENIYCESSPIQGIGIFSKNYLAAGSIVCPARVGDMRTIAGRYANHAMFPNAQMIVTDDGVDLVAISDIKPGDEITVNYRDVIHHRDSKGDLCQQ